MNKNRTCKNMITMVHCYYTEGFSVNAPSTPASPLVRHDYVADEQHSARPQCKLLFYDL